MFTAKVVSQPSPKELLVNVDNPAGDATLKFENPLKGTVDPGTAFKFKGVIDSYAKEPYMLTLTADKEDIEGLPCEPVRSCATGAQHAREEISTGKRLGNVRAFWPGRPDCERYKCCMPLYEYKCRFLRQDL